MCCVVSHRVSVSSWGVRDVCVAHLWRQGDRSPLDTAAPSATKDGATTTDSRSKESTTKTGVATANAAAGGKAGASCDAGRADADGSATSKTTDASAPAQSSPADMAAPRQRFNGISELKGNDTMRWRAQLYHGNKQFYLGKYSSADAAAHAYDTKARSLGW